jgi:hypothetical protein
MYSNENLWEAQKTTPPTILRCCENVFIDMLPSKYKVYKSNNSSIVACICYRRNIFIDTLPSSERRDTFYRAAA